MKFAKIQPRILIIIFFGLAIAFNYNQPVLADTIKDNSVDTIKQAAFMISISARSRVSHHQEFSRHISTNKII